jgi:hypothetical protein
MSDKFAAFTIEVSLFADKFDKYSHLNYNSHNLKYSCLSSGKLSNFRLIYFATIDESY